MASSYTTNSGIEKPDTGDQSGTWGATVNTNMDIIDTMVSGFIQITAGSTSVNLTTTDGAITAGMNRVIKYVDGGDLGGACTVTITPNDQEKLLFVENGLSGSQDLIFSQGSGANYTVKSGKQALIRSDGAGGGAAVAGVIENLQISTLSVTEAAVTIGDGTAEDTKLVYDGNAKDFYMGLDDSADKLVIGEGSTVGTNSILTLTDDTVTVGDGAAVDTAIVFDGNAKDFYVALDDSADKLLIGEGSTVGTNPILSITDDTVTLGDGAAVDTAIVFDGNAKDFYVALDDSADKLLIGEGSTVGTNPILSITDDAVTVGDGAAADTKIVFDGNAQDYYVGLDDSADDLVIGLGSTVGTTPAISINSTQITTFGKAAIGATQTATGQGGSTTLDFNTYQNFILTLTSNITLANPTTETVGQSGIIVFIQDGGSDTLSLGSDYETAGGAGITLSTADTSVDVIPYFIQSAGNIQLGAVQLAFS
jgi:hypothetical protein|tara:strand:+ start:829 stop:2268 length:1440 start_codon:yes stop_codon:yes gene_type:complete